jgi:hypothetical protein
MAVVFLIDDEGVTAREVAMGTKAALARARGPPAPKQGRRLSRSEYSSMPPRRVAGGARTCQSATDD